MLMKLTPGVYFTNVFRAGFSRRFSYQRLFSSYVLLCERKTRAKTLMKSTPVDADGNDDEAGGGDDGSGHVESEWMLFEASQLESILPNQYATTTL